MGRMYTLSFTDVAVTAAQDFFQIEAVTNPIIIHAIYLSQNSDVGDANAENLTVRIRRVTDALANVTAEVNLTKGDAASLADLNINDTTPLTTGAETIHSECWNIAIPFIWMPPPELRVVVPVSGSPVVTVNLVSAPTDSLTMSGVVYFEEIG